MGLCVTHVLISLYTKTDQDMTFLLYSDPQALVMLKFPHSEEQKGNEGSIFLSHL